MSRAKSKTAIAKPPKLRLLVASKKLNTLIDACVQGFKKLEDAIYDALEQGREEGFTDKQIGKMIRKKMVAAGYTARTITRILPASAKQKYDRYPETESDILSDYSKGEQPEEASDPSNPQPDEDPVIYQMPPETYDIRDLELYDKAFLIKLVTYLDAKLKELGIEASGKKPRRQRGAWYDHIRSEIKRQNKKREAEIA